MVPHKKEKKDTIFQPILPQVSLLLTAVLTHQCTLAMLRGAGRRLLRRAFLSRHHWTPSADAQADRVLLHGLLFHAHHGVLPEERVLGQRFEVDISLEVDTRAAGRSDDLHQTVNYAEAFEAVQTAVVSSPPCLLVEAVAHRTAAALLAAFPRAVAVHVRVRKPHVAIAGTLTALGARRRSAFPSLSPLTNSTTGVEVYRVRGEPSLAAVP